ncbi:MAG: hypothetical protein WA728_25940, partial [Xanthobacteraceae bacterium]
TGNGADPSGLSHRVRPRLYQYGAIVILGLFLLLSLFQPHPRAPAVLIDEFDAGCFQSPANGHVIWHCHRRFYVGKLGASDRGNPHP